MAIDRDDVLRSDFPVVRKGYDQSAVDAHLRKVASGVAKLAKAPPPKDTAGSAAAGKVQSIVEAAERSAEEIERQAREDADRTREQAAADAKEHVERVSAAAAEMRSRIDALGELVGRLGGDAGTIAADLERLREHVGEVRAGEEEAAAVPPPPIAAPPPPPSETAVAALEDELDDADALVAEMETTVTEADDREAQSLAAIRAAIEKESAPVHEELDEEAEEVEAELVEEDADDPDADEEEDLEGARIAALALVMRDEPREKIKLALGKFNLSDPDALIDDVTEKVGR